MLRALPVFFPLLPPLPAAPPARPVGARASRRSWSPLRACLLALGAALAVTMAVATPASAQTLVADINPGPGWSYPNGLTVYDGVLYLSADDGTSGQELRRYDAATGTVELVVDINPGAGGSRPRQPTIYDGDLYFGADDGASGEELWRYDADTGTAERVADVDSGDGSSDPRYLTVYDGALYFEADDGTSGSELWRYDAATGTVERVTDFPPGGGDYGASYLTVYDGALYFHTTGFHENDESIWRYDAATGTAERLAEDIPQISGGFTAYAGALYFGAGQGGSGQELWRFEVSGGTPTEPGAEPSAMALEVWPSPARGAASLRLTLEASESVRVEVYDGLGRQVAVLHDGPLAVGTHTLRFEAAGLPSGVYLARASGAAGTVSQRVTLLR